MQNFIKIFTDSHKHYMTEIILFTDKADPFNKEKQTIEALLSQWTEEEVPESELTYTKPQQELPCFNSNVIEATSQIFQPMTATPVTTDTYKPQDTAVIIELGAEQTTVPLQSPNLTQNLQTTEQSVPEPSSEGQDVVMEEGHTSSHGDLPKSGEFLPVEGGYIFVGGDVVPGK